MPGGRRRPLPEFPRTPHLPWEPSASPDDLVAAEAECAPLTARPPGQAIWTVRVDEKADGAGVAAAWGGDGPLLRSRSHHLRKSFAPRTSAKAQYAPLWGWLHEREGQLRELARLVGDGAAVYGEWLWARHTVSYDRLPSYLLAFDVWDPGIEDFLDPTAARAALGSAGFDVVPPLAAWGDCGTTEAAPGGLRELAALAVGPSELSTTDRREGAYFKVGDGRRTTHRFKAVRPGFRPSDGWSQDRIVRNGLAGRPRAAGRASEAAGGGP